MRLKMISALAAALLLAACASDDAAQSGDAAASGASTTDGISQGAVTPGSAEDFQQNVGDRVFFIVDTVTLTWVDGFTGTIRYEDTESERDRPRSARDAGFHWHDPI